MNDALQIYMSAFTKMDSFIYLLDQEGGLKACNQNLLRFLGFDRIGEHTIYSMLYQQGLWISSQIEKMQQHDINTLISGKKMVEDLTIINNKGTILGFEVSRIPLMDVSGNALGLMVSLRDITSEKRVAEQLKDLKNQLRHTNKMLGNADTVNDESLHKANPIKVLLIEDNLLTQKIEKNILLTCRCITDAVATPRQANEIFKPGKYDLVLMDIGLEEGNGYQITAALRKKEVGSCYRVPIIALTGYALAEIEYDCDDAEMDGIMSKPLTAIQTKQLIQRYIRHVDIEVTGLREIKH